MIELHTINCDVNGNPRRVVHFLDLLNGLDRQATSDLRDLYKIAVKRSHKIGGRKYHTKGFGGGIVFQCWSEDQLREAIRKVVWGELPDDKAKLFCTNSECLIGTDKFYKLTDEAGKRVDFGLCLRCASHKATSFLRIEEDSSVAF